MWKLIGRFDICELRHLKVWQADANTYQVLQGAINQKTTICEYYIQDFITCYGCFVKLLVYDINLKKTKN
jgi:hypothetical protein